MGRPCNEQITVKVHGLVRVATSKGTLGQQLPVPQHEEMDKGGGERSGLYHGGRNQADND